MKLGVPNVYCQNRIRDENFVVRTSEGDMLYAVRVANGGAYYDFINLC